VRDDGVREHNPCRDLLAAAHDSGAIDDARLDHARAIDNEGHHDDGYDICSCDLACGYHCCSCDLACGYHCCSCDLAWGHHRCSCDLGCGHHRCSCEPACGHHSAAVHNIGPVYDGEAEAPAPPSP
jgi:hypothetical protein